MSGGTPGQAYSRGVEIISTATSVPVQETIEEEMPKSEFVEVSPLQEGGGGGQKNGDGKLDLWVFHPDR